MWKSVIILFSLLFIMSCDKEKVFEQFQTIKGQKWNSKDILHFNVNIEDTTTAHNVLIAVRNTGQYEFSNLYLFVTTHSPDGKIIRDTTEIILANKRGKWLGKGSVAVYTLYYPYRSNVRFPLRGIYRFDIEQAMWTEELKYISHIGLRIEKASKKNNF